jgi:acyl-CoA synthetase (AMP-forming)/AMP-acid ligase II
MGVPDEVFGERVLAVVVAKPGTDINKDQVQLHCRTSLATFKIPSFVEFVDELPRNAGGKVVKGQLKDRFQRPETGAR